MQKDLKLALQIFCKDRNRESLNHAYRELRDRTLFYRVFPLHILPAIPNHLSFTSPGKPSMPGYNDLDIKRAFRSRHQLSKNRPTQERFNNCRHRENQQRMGQDRIRDSKRICQFKLPEIFTSSVSV